MLNVAPQKERISDHLRAMAEQDDKSAASGKTGEQSSIGVGCAPGEERDSAISICAVHSTTVTAAIAEYCEDTVEKQKTLTEVLDGLVDLTTRLASLATARRSAIVAGVVVTATENLGKALTQLGGTRFTQSQFVGQFTAAISAAWDDVAETVVADALGTSETKVQHWLQWSKTRAFEPLTFFLLYIHFTDLAYHDPRRHHEGHHHR